ncbi:hypothetical protein EJB05_05640, partial [Eragrostis curvula]
MGSTRPRHFVLFPFPGHGHLAGFLAITRLLRQELPDATVTLVSTPRNVVTLLASAADSSISFHALPFVPSDHGLPAGCESTNSLPVPAFIDLFEAFETLEPAFDDYISGLVRQVDVCIIADAFVAWTVDAARRHGCAHALFVSCGAFGTAVYHALWNNMPALPFDSDSDMLRLPEHPELVFHRSQMSPSFFFAGGRMDRWTAFYHRLIPCGYHTDAPAAVTTWWPELGPGVPGQCRYRPEGYRHPSRRTPAPTPPPVVVTPPPPVVITPAPPVVAMATASAPATHEEPN